MADVSDAEFATFVDRVINCRKAEDDAKEDTKQVYAEAAEKGIDKAGIGALVRSLRMDEKQASKAQMRDALVDDYRERYRRGRASHVRARVSASYAEATGREPVDPKLVETVVKGVQTEIGRKALLVAVDAMIEAEEAEPVQEMHKLPEGEATATRSDGDGTPAATNTPAESVSDEISVPHSHQQPSSSPDADKAEAVSSSPVSAAIPDDFDPSKLSFLNDKPKKSLRPHCLHPELCRSGFPREHCHTCKVAMAESEVA